MTANDSEVDVGFAQLALGMEVGRNKSGRGGKVEMMVGCVSACVRGGMGWIGKAKAGCGRVRCWHEKGLRVVQYMLGGG